MSCIEQIGVNFEKKRQINATVSFAPVGLDKVEEQLALKQDKEDKGLTTTSKTIVGAINELKTAVENGGGGGGEGGGDITIDQELSDTSPNAIANKAVYNAVDNLQRQIDGETSTWLYAGVPSVNTAPANKWTDNTIKKRHIGDVYINTLPLEANITDLDALGIPIWFENGDILNASDSFENNLIENDSRIRTSVLLKLKDEATTITFPSSINCSVHYYSTLYRKVAVVTYNSVSSITLTKYNSIRSYFALVIDKPSGNLSSFIQGITGETIFTNTYAGKAWRWAARDSHSTDYHWCQIADSDAVKALVLAIENQVKIGEHTASIAGLTDEVAELQSKIEGDSSTPAFTDVSLYATTVKGQQCDEVYVKAPAGMLKTTDKVIFARYITNKTRPRVNGDTDKSQPRKYYRGWIKPFIGSKHNTLLFIPDDMLQLVYDTTIDGYDRFELRVDPDDYNESLLFYLWDNASVDEDGYRHPRVKDRKLGIKIVRDGVTIVDYLPFTIKVDDDGRIHFGRL